MFGVLSIVSAIFQPVNQMGNAQNVALTSLASSFFIIVWVLAVSAYNIAWYSATMSPSLWNIFYTSGVSFAQALGDGNQVASNPDASCFVTLEIGNDQGLLFLLISLPIAFFLSIWMCIQRCCGGYDEYFAYPVGRP